MTQLATTLSTADQPGSALRTGWRTFPELGKIRLSTLVVITAVVGYLVAARGSLQFWTLLYLTIGTTLAACCANAMNQVMEADRDARMPRTSGRPIPSGRITRPHAALMAIASGGIGVTLLAAMVNGITALLALTTIVLYLAIYTPLKTRSSLNTIIGAIVGAIPPMMGWTAATGQIGTGGWILAAVLFVWQIPHFLALAWMYRGDYEQGGYRMLPMYDATGGLTVRAILIWTAALLPVTLAVVWAQLSGAVYGIVAVGLGLWMLQLAMVLYRDRTHAAARKLFMATVSYLPLLLLVMVLDQPWTAGAATAEPMDPPAAMTISLE